ncbi:MAG TPA: LysR substrate-binding domain-containing protein [Reyranella sp.]|nr:LysR substrate-binding domain-containing protein [Reyranella sp.]
MPALNPRQIEAFRAVILAGGVGAAANLINVTQPAVSRLIHDLQHHLGLKLFERRGTRLVPTNDALSLYAEVERSFVGLDRIAETAADLRTRRSAYLRIAALPALSNGFLPRFVGGFLAERPKLNIVLSGMASHAVVTAVAQGQFDLGFAEVSIGHAATETDRLPAAPYVAVIPQTHRLARKSKIRPRDFEGENFISLGTTSVSRFRIDRLFNEHNVARVMRIETPLSEIVCSLAGSGIGVALCDPFTANEYASRGIVRRPFEPRLEFEIGVVYAAHRPISPVAREFIDSFKAHVANFLRRGPVSVRPRDSSASSNRRAGR